jgi:hypothetical protein
MLSRSHHQETRVGEENTVLDRGLSIGRGEGDRKLAGRVPPRAFLNADSKIAERRKPPGERSLRQSNRATLLPDFAGRRAPFRYRDSPAAEILTNSSKYAMLLPSAFARRCAFARLRQNCAPPVVKCGAGTDCRPSDLRQASLREADRSLVKNSEGFSPSWGPLEAGAR